MAKTNYRIGQVARLAGVNVETVRYYERRELIPSPPKRESGYRDYPPETIQRIRFIKRAQELGFTLKEISELLYLAMSEEATCADIRALAVDKLSGIEQKIEHLKSLKEALSRLIQSCSGSGPREECPILDSIAGDDE